MQAWKKIGMPEILAKKSVRSLMLQKFEDPYRKTVGEYTLFGGSTFASIVMPVTQDNQVLAIWQYRHGADKILLEFPGGGPKTPDQTPEEVAAEELFEETIGYTSKRIIKLNPEPLWFDPSTLTTPFHAFLALDCVKSDKVGELDEGEYVELVKIPLAQWLEMCLNGQVTDSKSVTVTYLSLKHLGYKVGLN